MKPILIIIPSLNREKSKAEAIESLAVNGTGKHDVLTLSGGGGTTAALNSVPMELLRQYEVIGLFNDDTRMRTSAWDEKILAILIGRPGLVYGRDGIQDSRLCTHPFISSSLIQAVGYIQPPQLYHFYGDNFWGELLAPLKLLYYCPEIFTEHFNAPCLGLPQDSTTCAEMAHWESDGRAWNDFFQNELPAVRDRVRASLCVNA